MREFDNVGRCFSQHIYVAGMPFGNECLVHRIRGREDGEKRPLEEIDEQMGLRTAMRR